MILDDLRHWIGPIAGALGPVPRVLQALPRLLSLEDLPLEIEADAACNLALLLAKPLKKSPRALAQELQKCLSQGTPLVEEITIAGAGFLQFSLAAQPASCGNPDHPP